MESEKNTNAIDLQHLWKLFVQHVRMILIWTVGLGVIAWGIATFVIPLSTPPPPKSWLTNAIAMTITVRPITTSRPTFR